MAILLGGMGALHAEDSRDYEAGPLQISDFRAKVPEGKSNQAFTLTTLRYSYRYRSRTRDRSASVVLTKLDFKNKMLRDQSWNGRPQDTALLAHEQGHFDITEAVRKRAEQYFQAKLSSLRTTGRTLDDAVAAMEELVRKEMAPYFLRLELLQKKYDLETNHGLATERQQQWSKLVSELIENPQLPFPPLGDEPAAAPPR
ncbi:MAG: hypothetical protein KDB14_32185 [Planctomycetales bacterium]|nr:hypothetical protein [Planctomycetales bacterium]